MSEKNAYEQLKENHINKIPKNDLWYYKPNEKGRHGVPDLILCYLGIFVIIELKDTEVDPSLLTKRHVVKLEHPFQSIQVSNLNRVNTAGGIAFGLVRINGIFYSIHPRLITKDGNVVFGDLVPMENLHSHLRSLVNIHRSKEQENAA